MQSSCRWAAYTLENQSRQPADLERSALETLFPTHDRHSMKSVAFVLAGFTLGVFATFCFVNFTKSLPPDTPIVPNPESITVFLHPWGGREAATTKAVRIPTESQEQIFRRLVPEAFYGNVYENVTPLVAEAVITHADKTRTSGLVRDGGHNPAIVSVDGVTYFYAKTESDVYAAADELIRMVAEMAYKQQAQPISE